MKMNFSLYALACLAAVDVGASPNRVFGDGEYEALVTKNGDEVHDRLIDVVNGVPVATFEKALDDLIVYNRLVALETVINAASSAKTTVKS